MGSEEEEVTDPKWRHRRLGDRRVFQANNDLTRGFVIYPYWEDGSLQVELGGGGYRTVKGERWATVEVTNHSDLIAWRDGQIFALDLIGLRELVPDEHWAGPYDRRRDAINDAAGAPTPPH